MDTFVGTWKLLHNGDFESFLKFCGYNWVKRRVALASNIDLIITSESDNEINREVASAFFNTNEKYVLDNKPRVNEEGLTKKHRFNDGKIKTEVAGVSVDWNEEISVDGNTMTVLRTWTVDGTDQKSVQVFERRP